MNRFFVFLVALIVTPVSLSYGQAAPPLGSDFIFFRNGVNVTIPNVESDGLDADPNDPNDVSIRFDYGDWRYPAFGWERGVGVDATANHAAGNILHVKLRVDPGNSGKADTFIMFEDKTNDQPDDLPMRMVWRIPESMKDGNWHTLDIPLPPQKCEDLASARGTLGLADNWYYGGSWSQATERVGGYDDECANTGAGGQYWKEFEWNHVKSLGVFWDYNTGGGSIWLDDVYIGQQGLDLTVADGAPEAMSGISVETMSDGNKVMWTHNPAFGGYKVYGSSKPFMNASEEGVYELGTFAAGAEDLSLTHYLQYLHPEVAPGGANPLMYDAYYAVASLSQFGVENSDVSNSGAMAKNNNLELGPVILELTDAEESMLVNDLAGGNASGMAFHNAWLPFKLNQSQYTLADAANPPDSDDDLSAMFWLGYSQRNELWLYAEVRDDEVALQEAAGVGNPWEYDVIEIGWSNYDVVEAGGDPIFSTPHLAFARGMYADYQLRVGGRGMGASATAYAEVANPGGGEVGSAVYNEWMDDSGNVIGYKILTSIPLDKIQDASTGDAVLDAPTGMDPWRIHAIDIVLNDRDDDSRQTQIQTSRQPNADGQWWNTPAQWAPVAMAPRSSHPIATEGEVPSTFTLDQNYPNPFNPQTSIAFTLGSAQRVTLTVHDVLGRTVATLLQDQPMASGSHIVPFSAHNLASGMYIYRIQAGSAFTQTRSMTVIR